MSAYRRPGWVTTNVYNKLLLRLNRAPGLAVRGRRTGEWHVNPVWPLDVEGDRYLVAPRGDTHWARNLRVTGEGELRWGSRVEPFTATEIPRGQRARFVDAYLRAYGKRYGGYVGKEFAEMPDPADHPVFLVKPKP